MGKEDVAPRPKNHPRHSFSLCSVEDDGNDVYPRLNWIGERKGGGSSRTIVYALSGDLGSRVEGVIIISSSVRRSRGAWKEASSKMLMVEALSAGTVNRVMSESE